MLEVYDLTCEYESAPIAVAVPRPRFSWKLVSDRPKVVQVAYRIEVGEDAGFAEIFWDSGFIKSPSSHLVEYEGPSLEECTRYFWRVTVRDDADNQSASLKAALFETAMQPASWKAPFIGMDIPAGETTSRPIYLRKELTIEGEPASARVYTTALGVYELWINGTRVDSAFFAPGWTNYRKRLAYQTYDVTDLLQPGANVIGAVVGAGWYSGDLTWTKRREFYGKQSALSLELRATTDKGTPSPLMSDESWQASYGPILYSELYHGERYDARKGQPGWSSPGFETSGWSHAVLRDFPRERLVAQEGPLVRKQEHLEVREVITTPKGETVLDFGQNLTGWVRFTVRGSAGQRVVLRHAEVLDAEGNFYTENLRDARAEIEYILQGDGEESFEPHFTFHGFRFVRVDEWPGSVDPANFTAVVLHSEMESTLSFECSNPLLNQLHHNILWGWKGNAVDVPTDCPQRDERLGWTGDAEVFIGTATYLTQSAGFYRRWLRDLASEQFEDGGIPFVVPDIFTPIASEVPMFTSSHSSTGWGDAAVICPWTVYEHYGDRRLLVEQYVSMKAWVEYIRTHAEGGLIWNTGFHFGDWVALDAKEGSYFGATPNDLTATAFYAYSTELVARAARALGKSEDAAGYEKLHADIVEAYRREFITPSGRIAARTQTAHILSLVFGLVPREQRGRVVRDLAQLIDENGGHLTTGFLGTPFICKALADNGRLDAAYELLLRDDYPSWLYQITKGATTVWEHWDGIKPDGTMWSPDMNSFNHYAYGAIGEWIYATIGGLSPDPDDPGFHTAVLAPRPGGGITHAKTAYQGPYGKIELEWRLEGERLMLDAVVPPNSSGRFRLQGVAATRVKAPDGVVFSDSHDAAEAVVGSGRWHLECPWPEPGRPAK
jgi:alpha-L-rhamnosidase